MSRLVSGQIARMRTSPFRSERNSRRGSWRAKTTSSKSIRCFA